MKQDTSESRVTIAVDTGGTFTDLVRLDGQRARRLKVPSTPRDPAEAVLRGVRELLEEGEAFELLHGSTVATNTLLERTGARVKLVTNRGFEDVIEIGRQDRPQLYALVGHRLPPPVARPDRIGIRGRLDHAGIEIEGLDPEELDNLASRVADADAVAVVLLHSYADGGHEERVAEALATLSVPVSISHRVLPEYREFERTSTTVVNAYVQPRMQAYLSRLEREGGAARFHVMGSDGGTLSSGRAREEPVRTVLSGPAGGVVGGRAWGRRTGRDRIITFDMGGTSTDVAICPGRLLHTRETEIGGQPIAIPVLDIYTVGAGGGSVAWLDSGGALRVGPASAGADPGPVCYGQGGRRITVTDANVWLGRLPPDAFLGGQVALDRDAVEAPLQALADRLGATPDATAAGILRIAETAMSGALRVISVERGFDPEGFTLVAFGGAGGLHAAQLAEGLGISSVLVPPDPGLLSAFGMLAAPARTELARTMLRSTAEADVEAHVARVRAELDGEARQRFDQDFGAVGDVTTEHWVDARYRGQSFELRVPADEWAEGFHRAHRERYGYGRPDSPVEVIAVRVVAVSPRDAPAPAPVSGEPGGTEPVRVWSHGAWASGSRVWRRGLSQGDRITGPALVLEYSGTTWVPERWSVRVDGGGCLEMVRDDD